MSESFETDVRDLLMARISEASAALDWSEIERRALGLDRATPSRGRRKAPVVWLGVAAAVVLVIGGVVLMLRNGDSGSVVIDEGPDSTVDEQPEPTIDDATSPDEDPTGENQEGREQTPGAVADEEADEGTEDAQVPQPVTLAAPLAAPIGGETQQSIVGDITWTRLVGDETTIPSDVRFWFEGEFYGGPAGSDWDGPEGWWTSPDGVAWTAWEDGPDDTSVNTRVAVVGDKLWFNSDQSGPGSQPPVLSYWDGSRLVAVDLPASGEPPPDGLTIRRAGASVVAEFGGEYVIARDRILGVPWGELLGIDSPLEASGAAGPWEDTFTVRGTSLVVRPEIVQGSPTRIDLYDNATGELITSVVPPDDGRPIDEVLFTLGAENVFGRQIDHLVVDSDGATARTADWPFTDAQFAELGGQLFALARGVGGELQLWVTDDLDGWEQLALPDGVDEDGWSRLASDGSIMMLTTQGPSNPDGSLAKDQPTWITTDGTTWTAWEPVLPGRWTRSPEAADFGWFDAHMWDPNPDLPPNETPSIVLSLDAETWQAINVPIPGPLAERGLTWADAGQTGDNPWEWRTSAHGTAIFVTLDSEGLEQARELWIGHVDTS